MKTIAPAFRSLPLLALFALSCSSSSTPATAPTDGGSGDTRVSGDASGDTSTSDVPLDTAGDCVPDPDLPPPPGSVCVRTVKGSVVDEKGAGVDGLVETVCGPVCYFGHKDGATPGAFAVHVGKLIPTSIYNVIVHGGGDRTSSYNPMPTLDASGDGSMSKPLVAATFDKIGGPLPADGAGGSVSAGSVTLTAPSGTAFELDVDFVALGAPGRVFKSWTWKGTDLPLFAAGSNVVQLVALGPFGSKSCHSAPCAAGDKVKLAVSMTNDAALPAGTAVEFLTLGFDLSAKPFSAGQMNVEALGHVSADGRTIDTDSGEGITMISWVGVRKKG